MFIEYQQFFRVNDISPTSHGKTRLEKSFVLGYLSVQSQELTHLPICTICILDCACLAGRMT